MPAKEIEVTSTAKTVENDENPVVEDAVAKGVGYEYPVLSSPVQYLLLGLIVLVIPASIFVFCGGVQWMRRKLHGSKGEYKRVRGQDLEK